MANDDLFMTNADRMARDLNAYNERLAAARAANGGKAQDSEPEPKRPTNTEEAITAQLNSVRVWDVLSGMLMRDRGLDALPARAAAARILKGFGDTDEKEDLRQARTQAILNDRRQRGV